MTYDKVYIKQKKYPLVHSHQVSAALEIITEDISRHISLKDLANRAGTNECTLKKRFKEMLNVTIYQYLVDQRMKKAYILITGTAMKEMDIALECGFQSLPGFISTFRTYVGLSPGALR